MSAPAPSETGDRLAWSLMPFVAWTPPIARVVAVVPHPDDEVLGCGGLLAHGVGAGREIVVVAVTDGEAARGGVDRELAARRRVEQHAALDVLGVEDAAVLRCGLPDAAVGDHIDDLIATLVPIVSPADLLVAPWLGDGHPDHVACGVAARHVADRVGCDLLGTVVWGPLWGPPPGPGERPLLRLELTENEHNARDRAMRCHVSQTDPRFGPPVVDDELLRRLRQPFETYVRIDRGGGGGT